jgi:hypothetical protein
MAQAIGDIGSRGPAGATGHRRSIRAAAPADPQLCKRPQGLIGTRWVRFWWPGPQGSGPPQNLPATLKTRPESFRLSRVAGGRDSHLLCGGGRPDSPPQGPTAASRGRRGGPGWKAVTSSLIAHRIEALEINHHRAGQRAGRGGHSRAAT